MRINTKIFFVALSGIVLLGVVTLFLSLQAIQKRGAAETEFAQKVMMEEKKSKLQDLIKSTYAVIQAHYDYSHDPEKVAATYRPQLKGIVDVAYKTIEAIYNRVDLDDAEKKRLAAGYVAEMRYNESDYLWINDMEPRMVMHPFKPSLNGKDLTGFKDPNGKALFVEFVKVCRQSGEGTVDYLWPKPGHDQPVAKLSYVKLFKPWNWVIGTGVYLEVAEQRFMEDAKKAVAQMRYGTDAREYFWINDMQPRMVMHPIKTALNGKDLSTFKDPNGKTLFNSMVDTCRSNGEGFVDYMWPMPEHEKPVPKLSYVKLFAPWGWIVGTGIYLDDVEQAVVSKQAEIQDAVASQRNRLVVSIVVLFLLTTAAVAVMSRHITRPILRASDMLKDIAQGEGDLTRRLDVKSRDEVGEMAKWFNVFIENIHNIIREVAGNAEQVKESATGLKSISEQVSQGAAQTSSKTNTVAAASEEMSTNMNGVAAAMEQASSNIGRVASAAEEMTATIGEIASNTAKASGITSEAVDQAGNTSSQVAELGSAAKEIGNVIETITDISEQVNLLALNATIEAARAGDAGKGFAVVANEIKDLAAQTAAATGEIKTRIEGIQNSTDGTVTQIGHITRVVNEVNEIVTIITTAIEEQRVTTKEIAANVAQAAQGINEVNDNVGQSSGVSSEISRDISEVTLAAEEISESSNQISTSAESLSTLANQLNRMVGRFRI
jgi:methyl-accepting chemotaxis protein